MNKDQLNNSNGWKDGKEWNKDQKDHKSLDRASGWSDAQRQTHSTHDNGHRNLERR